MKFAHLADVHIGSWRDPLLRDMSTDAFLMAMDRCVELKVDFILISGDLFHTSMPRIDNLKQVVRKLREIRLKGIPIYFIAGSHDFSPTGKTMLDVLEEADLGKNVVQGDVREGKLFLRFTIDEKTGAKIAGMVGKRGMLDRKYYEFLDRKSLEQEEGFKIFMFHTAITEMKPKELEKMESSGVSLLPAGFDYYAGGHVHIVERGNFENRKNVVFPGPLFPNNFSELEKLKQGGFYIYDEGNVVYHPLVLKEVELVEVNADHRLPEEVSQEVFSIASRENVSDKIILLRIAGRMQRGKSSDIAFRKINETFIDNGAYCVLKSISKLKSEEFEEIKVSQSTAEELEQELIQEHLGQIKISFSSREEDLIRKLMDVFSVEKEEGQKVYEYESSIKKDAETLFSELIEDLKEEDLKD